MSEDSVDIRFRLRGARQAKRESDDVARGLKNVGDEARKASLKLDLLKASGAGVSGTLRGIGRGAWTSSRYVAGFAGAMTAFSVGAGLKFNATMEQNEVAFRHFLGSTKAAKGYLGELYTLAAHTPFEFPQLTGAAKRMLAFGFGASEALDVLRNIGDAAAGLGTGAEGIDRMVIALGQMKTKGVIQGDELLQLQEAGVNAYKYLIKAGIISRSDIGSIGKMHLSSARAIKAINAGLKKDFGGLSAEQAKTFSGQLSTLRDNTNQALGAVTLPAFKWLRDDVFPELNDSAESLAAIFKRDDLTIAQKFAAAKDAVSYYLSPLADEVERELKKADLGGKLAGFVEDATPRIADAAAKAAPKAAGAFVNAWLHMGPWGKLLTVGLIAKRLGVFGVLGGRAADKFVDTFVTSTGPKLEAGKGRMRPGLRRFGLWAGGIVGAAIAYETANLVQKGVADIFGQFTDDLDAADKDPTVRNARRQVRRPGFKRDQDAYFKRHPEDRERAFRLNDRDIDVLLRRGFPGLVPGGPGIPKDYVPGTPYRPKALKTPMALPRLLPAPLKAREGDPGYRSSAPIITEVYLDGKKIAEALGRRTAGKQNRK